MTDNEINVNQEHIIFQENWNQIFSLFDWGDQAKVGAPI